MTPSPTRLTRRQFLGKTALAGAFTIIPSHWVLGQKASGNGLPPSELINLAVIGIGNQGAGDLKIMAGTNLCRVVALCDVDLEGEHVRETLAAHPDAVRFTDFRKMFDRMADQIDAVLVATPDHSHFCATMLAMSLGKPVFVEKPLAHTFGQCQRLMEMAERSGVVTQMGNQGHSTGNFFQFKAWTEAGIIRDVTRITAFMNMHRRWHGWGATATGYPTDPMPAGLDWDQWIDQAPENPFSARLHPQGWRSWFEYGSGAFGDWGPHILDTCHRFLDLGLPEKVVPVRVDGANPFVYPQNSTIRFEFPSRGDMPACVVTWHDGQTNVPEVEKELGGTDEDGNFTPVDVSKPGKIIHGKDHVFLGGSHSATLRILPLSKFMEMRRELPRFSEKNSNHYMNFLRACKGEEEARSPFSISGPLTQFFTLGILAQRLGGEIHFDRETKRITNNPQAQALLDPPPRKGWEEFFKL